MSGSETQQNLQEKVFDNLLSDETCDNQYCCDCGAKLLSSSLSHSAANMNCYDHIYVSVNHGIFLCSNCAYIHQMNYGVEISFVKKVMETKQQPETQSSLYSKQNNPEGKVMKLS